MSDLFATLMAAANADQSAEAKLNESVQSNYPQLAQALAAELATEGKDARGRSMASLYLKNTLNAKNEIQQKQMHDRWKQVDEGVRSSIKTSLLSAVRSADPQVPRMAAVAAAEVACVELPHNAWPNFVSLMQEALRSPDATESTKVASLQCLGFVCERIDNVQRMIPEIPDLPEATVDLILTTLVEGIQNPSNGIKFAALEALEKSLGFVHKNMETAQERDIIMKTICESTSSPESRTRELSFQCMHVIADLYYDKLQDYMTTIYQLTSASIQNGQENEEVKMAALEFWSTVAETERLLLGEEETYELRGIPLDRPPCKRYIASALTSLVPILLGTLSQQPEELDDDERSLRQSGALCLDSIAMLVHGDIVQHVMPFVQQNITETANWRNVDAAIIAFTSIMEGIPTDIIGPYVSQSIPVLLHSFQAETEMVRDSAVFCVSKICASHPMAIPQNQINTIIEGLLAKLSSETPRLSAASCSAIFNLARSIKTSMNRQPTETNVLTAPMFPLLTALLATIDRSDADEGNLRISALSATSELIDASASDTQQILGNFFPEIAKRMGFAMTDTTMSIETKESIMSSYICLLTCLYQRLPKESVIALTDTNVTNALTVLQSPNDSYTDVAFSLMGSVAGCLGEDFEKYVEAFMPFLIGGLRNFHSLTLCNVCVGVVVDLCEAIGPKLQPHCDAIMGALTDCLKDSGAHRDTKPIVIECFGDIALAIGAAYEPYLNISTMLLMQAASAQVEPDNDDLADFINSLRCSVLDSYSNILFGLSEGNAMQLFHPSIHSVLTFLQFLSTPTSYKNDECLLKAVSLVGDMAKELGESVKAQLQQPFIQALIQEAMQSPNQELNLQTTGQWALSQL